MHYVDLDEIREVIPDKFERRAERALQAVERAAQAAEAQEREKGSSDDEIKKAVHSAISKAIDSRTIWTELTDLLGNLRHKKCWYCDSAQWRSDMPIEHFRPKKEVTEDSNHPGYWWLAFDWKNYRYSCTFCNSHRTDEIGNTEGGKQNHFPLVEGSRRAFSKDEDHDAIEKPVLLDPIRLDDPKMLIYQPNGFPRWNPNKVKNKSDKYRVDQSIILYHLHHAAAVRSRKTIASRIENYVQRIDKLYLKKPRTTDTQDQINDLKRDLLKLIYKKADYSVAAIQYLQQFHSRGWVEDLLDLIHRG